MNMSAFSNKRWKVTLMEGEGELYVFADTAEMAKQEAFGQYRRRRYEINNTPIDKLIVDVESAD